MPSVVSLARFDFDYLANTLDINRLYFLSRRDDSGLECSSLPPHDSQTV